MVKVINPGDMVFEEDIKLDEDKIDSPLSLPPCPLLTNDEVQIVYNGRIFSASKKQSTDKLIKVYTMIFGLEEKDNPKMVEDKYFSDNLGQIKKAKEEFVKAVVQNDLSTRKLGNAQLGQELAARIEKRITVEMGNAQAYVGKGLITKLDDGSVFNDEMKGIERVLLLDGRVYDLLSMKEYISLSPKGMFRQEFYEKLLVLSDDKTPEQIVKEINDNLDKVHRDAISKSLPAMKNKIWHSERSGKIFLDGVYWIPNYRGNSDDNSLEYQKIVTAYQKLLERKIKVDAARSIR